MLAGEVDPAGTFSCTNRLFYPTDNRQTRLPPMTVALRSLAYALSLALASATAAAQPALAVAATDSTADSTVTPRPRDVRLYVGMTTLHFEDVGAGPSNDRLVAVSWGRYYAATFINTFGVRSWSAGVQGEFRRRGAPVGALSLGYRAGLITGYDERFIELAGRTPVLPLLQPLLTVQRSRLGLELSYSGVVASLGVFVRL